jgi:cytochrome c553
MGEPPATVDNVAVNPGFAGMGSTMKARRLLAIALAALIPQLMLGAATVREDLQRATRATPDLERGAALFAQCVSCHGSDGAGQSNGNTPRIAGQHYPVLLKQLVDFRHGKRWDFRMEAMANRHHLEGPQDIADVAAYVARLEGSDERGLGDGKDTSEGAYIFGTDCAACHGASGEGDEKKIVPRLGGQHYGYLMRQMYDAVDGRRLNLDRVHRRKLEPLDFAQIRAVSDYLARIDWDTPPAPSPAR